MELLQLKYFAHAAASENFSKTAAHFMVPQSAISQTIKKLENELEVQLFTRKGNRIYLNDNGAVFKTAADTALSALEDGKRALSDISKEPAEELRLLVRTNRRVVAENMYRFNKLYPGVTFSIMHDSHNSNFSEYDLIIAEKSPVFKNFEGIHMLKEKIKLAVSSSHPLSGRKTVSVEELSDQRFIVMLKGSSLNTVTYDLCRKHGFEPNTAIESEDPLYIRKYVSLDIGVAFVPEISWKDLFDDSVTLIDIDDPDAERVTNVYRNSKRYHSVAARMFRDFLIENVRKDSR